jgi:hypothetical protein
VTFVGISPKWSKPEWTLQELYAPDIIFLTVCIARVKEAFSFLQRPVLKVLSIDCENYLLFSPQVPSISGEESLRIPAFTNDGHFVK